MASRGLTTQEGLLLQRYHDGELSAAESVEAEQLLERDRAARVYLRALEELSEAVEAAGARAWRRAKDRAPSPEELLRAAEEAGDLSQAPLEELEPLLDRFHDGEVDQTEMAVVSALLEEREDVAEYLARLDRLHEGLMAAEEALVDGVDFDGMWNRIEAEIDGHEGDEQPTFERDEHLVLLHRYADGEVDEPEAAIVERWLEGGDEQVAEYLEVIDELRLGVTAAAETACERAPLRDIWSGVREAIEREEADGSVVSLGQAREERDAATGGATASGAERQSWWHDYRQAIVGAVAAALVLAGLAALFKDAIFGPEERVVVEERVVFVDQVEYSPGASVMIDSPTRQAGMQDADGETDEADEDDPTVIWLLDSDDEEGQGPQGPQQHEPAQPGDQPDAGGEADDDDEPDAGPMPKGQPI